LIFTDIPEFDEFLEKDPFPRIYWGYKEGIYADPNTFCFVYLSCDDFGIVDGKWIAGPVIHQEINVTDPPACSGLCWGKGADYFMHQTRSPQRCWCKSSVELKSQENNSHRAWGRTFPYARTKSCQSSKSRSNWRPNDYGVEYPVPVFWKMIDDDTNATDIRHNNYYDESDVLIEKYWVSQLLSKGVKFVKNMFSFNATSADDDSILDDKTDDTGQDDTGQNNGGAVGSEAEKPATPQVEVSASDSESEGFLSKLVDRGITFATSILQIGNEVRKRPAPPDVTSGSFRPHGLRSREGDPRKEEIKFQIQGKRVKELDLSEEEHENPGPDGVYRDWGTDER
jgi:hypothetical protein